MAIRALQDNQTILERKTNSKAKPEQGHGIDLAQIKTLGSVTLSISGVKSDISNADIVFADIDGKHDHGDEGTEGAGGEYSDSHSASQSFNANTDGGTIGETLPKGGVIEALAEFGDNYYNNKSVSQTPGEDESRYEKWTEKQVLIWLKENLMNNLFDENIVKAFLNEFAQMRVSGSVLHTLKNDNNKVDQLRNEFSDKNQAFGIWVVVQNCIENVGQNINAHVD